MQALVLIPTYNERQNLPRIVDLVLAVTGTRVLVIDDGSPDGTGEVADALAEKSGGAVSVMHRKGPRGLGRSYLDGFRAAVSDDRIDLVCQLDADLSHDPRFLPAMFSAIAAGADLVIGSRYQSGGGVENWPLHRRLLSAFANRYVRLVTGLRVGDCTSGFRCWRRSALARLSLDHIVSDGYAFLVEVTYQAAATGLRLSEIPIIFVERREGSSKMSLSVLGESAMMPWHLVASHGRIGSRRSTIPRSP
jgi:dolichol-phosphate mannosyltransferase